MLNRGPKHNPQLAIPMLKSDLFDLLGVEERLEVNNLWTSGKLTSSAEDCD